jgi:glutathione reductase (NADPH)
LQKAGGTVLGATILGPHAEEQINVLALAIRHGLDGKSIGETLFAYPTGSSDMEYFFK